MQTRHLAAGALLLAVSAAGARSAAAQTPTPAPAPSVTLGGVMWAQYAYYLTGQADGLNNFDVTRAYLNVIGRFDEFGSRVTADVNRGADGALGYRLKYAYVTFSPAGSPFTFKLGQMQTAWVDFEETMWDYRMQGPTVLDRGDQIAPLGYLSSSDFGAGVDARWDGERVNGQLAVVNGENYNRAPGDKRKDVQLRVSVRLHPTDDNSRVGGLRLSAYAHLGKPTSGGARNRFVTMLSYRSRRLTLAGEFARTRDSVVVGSLTPRSGQVVSAFGVLRLPDSPVALIGRVDVVDPDINTTANRQTRIIAGVSHQLRPNLRLLANVDHLSYQGGAPTTALETLRSQALCQVQLTF
jgi:hypothetical protein